MPEIRISGVPLLLVCNRGVEHDPQIQTSKLLRRVFSVSCRYHVLRVLFISFSVFLCVMGRHGAQGPPAAPVRESFPLIQQPFAAVCPSASFRRHFVYCILCLSLLICTLVLCWRANGLGAERGVPKDGTDGGPTRMTVFAHEQLRTPQNRRKMDLKRSTPSGHFLWECHPRAWQTSDL